MERLVADLEGAPPIYGLIGVCYGSFVWWSYTATRAVGMGELIAAAPTSLREASTVIVLSRPRRVCGRLRFTRFRFAEPIGGPTLRLNRRCSAYRLTTTIPRSRGSASSRRS